MSSKASTVIQGERVFLKHPRRGELGFIRQLWSDPDTMKAVGGPIDLEERQAKEWFAQMVDPGSESDCYFLLPKIRKTHRRSKLSSMGFGKPLRGFEHQDTRRVSWSWIRVRSASLVSHILFPKHAGELLNRRSRLRQQARSTLIGKVWISP